MDERELLVIDAQKLKYMSLLSLPFLYGRKGLINANLHVWVNEENGV